MINFPGTQNACDSVFLVDTLLDQIRVLIHFLSSFFLSLYILLDRLHFLGIGKRF